MKLTYFKKKRNEKEQDSPSTLRSNMITISPTDSRFAVPTDTIIVTSSKLDPTSDSNIQSLRSELLDPILAANTVTASHPLEIIPLPSLRRVLIISPTVALSSTIYNQAGANTALSNLFTFKYSRRNTKVEVSTGQYLELPEHKTIFLISPPTSPPPEFDYSRCEEEPSKEIFALNDHLSGSNNPGSDMNVNIEYMIAVAGGKEVAVEEEREITLIESKSGKITVSPCLNNACGGGSNNSGAGATIPRIVPTALPPKSIFDTDDEDDDIPG